MLYPENRTSDAGEPQKESWGLRLDKGKQYRLEQMLKEMGKNKDTPESMGNNIDRPMAERLEFLVKC